MANVTCSFVCAGGARGGKLTGPGFPGGGTPVLNPGDTLTVTVQWAGANPPPAMNGYAIFTRANGSTQNAPSPFKSSSGYICLDPQGGQRSAGGPTTFSFADPSWQVQAGLGGNYELTFVAEINTGTPSVVQWSADPEFDTTN